MIKQTFKLAGTENYNKYHKGWFEYSSVESKLENELNDLTLSQGEYFFTCVIYKIKIMKSNLSYTRYITKTDTNTAVSEITKTFRDFR